jgi:D-amino-acid dehydrogenase
MIRAKEMKFDVAVLGAGMIGVCCALHLQAKGKSVVVIDRRAPGLETSFGNAGIIQREAIEPYELPRDLSFLLSSAMNRRVDVRYHASALPQLIGPLSVYYRNSTPQAHAVIARAYESIIALSLETHQQLIQEARATSLQGQPGYLTLFRTEPALDKFFAKADKREQHGIRHRKLDAAAIRALEPAVNGPFIGGVHWLDPIPIKDPGALVQAYARLFEERGGKIALGNTQDLQRVAGSTWQLPVNEGGVIQADRVVVALGPWSVALTRRFGYTPPLFSKRGYHMHYAPKNSRQLNHPAIDAEFGYVVVPMNGGIRLTTGAELALVDAPATPDQLDAAEEIAKRDFPLGDRIDTIPWKGARPCMPDMKPVIGEVPGVEGMWCAFGHGHQGFTLGPVTGELLAAMMTGATPRVDMRPFSPSRAFV